MEEETGETPVPLLDRPVLYDELEFVYTAFWMLDSSRSVSFTIGAIPYSEITSWMNENRIAQDRRDILRYFFREMDRVYVSRNRR